MLGVFKQETFQFEYLPVVRSICNCILHQMKYLVKQKITQKGIFMLAIFTAQIKRHVKECVIKVCKDSAHNKMIIFKHVIWVRLLSTNSRKSNR